VWQFLAAVCAPGKISAVSPDFDPCQNQTQADLDPKNTPLKALLLGRILVRPMKRCLVIVLFAFFVHTSLADSISAPRKEDLIYAPRPEYPYDARRRNLQGSGMFILRIRPDGTVSRVDRQRPEIRYQRSSRSSYNF